MGADALKSMLRISTAFFKVDEAETAIGNVTRIIPTPTPELHQMEVVFILSPFRVFRGLYFTSSKVKHS